MNAALELGSCSARQHRASSCWPHLRRTCTYEYVGRACGLRNEPTEGGCSAFWGGNRIAGQSVKRRNEAAPKILDLCKRVRLSAPVFQFENRSFVKRSGGWVEMPRARLFGRRHFPDKVIKRSRSVSDASSRADRGVERGRVAFVP